MKTHKKKLCYVVFIAVALALCTAIALCSCTPTVPEDNTPPQGTTYTVTFDSCGGTNVSSLIVEKSSKITAPTQPERTGYVFMGWYKDSGYNNAWNFTTDTVEGNITLYAKWNPEGTIVNLSEQAKSSLYYGTYGGEAEIEPIVPPTKADQSYFGVGRAINVLKDKYATITAQYEKTFDTDKLLKLNWHKSALKEFESVDKSGRSMEELYSGLMTNASAKINGGASISVFTADVESKYSLAAKTESRKMVNEIYFNAYQNIAGSRIEIDAYSNLDKFQNILSDEILDAAQMLNEGNMTANDFFSTFGTHVAMAGIYGGRLECSYYLGNTEEKWNSSVEFEMSNKVRTSIMSLMETGLEVTSNISSYLGLNQSKTQESFRAVGKGGIYLNASSVKQFNEKREAWVNSFNENEDNYSVLIDFPDNSLAAIWDLLPDTYAQAKSALQMYFASQMNSQYDEFIAKFMRDPLDGGVSGGNGTAKSPYQIADAQQFKSIMELGAQDIYLELTDSFDLKKWVPCEFKGHLNGNGHTITYRQELDQNADYYGGLFSTIENATIENLYLDVSIYRANNQDNYVGKVGALAGQAKEVNLISKVSVSGKIYVNAANAYVGGIIGLLNGGTIEKCNNKAEVTGRGGQFQVGGIVGVASPEDANIDISNCYNIGALKGISGRTWWRFCGGIAGQVNTHKVFHLNIFNCYNDSEAKLELTYPNLGSKGCAGIFGDICENRRDNFAVSQCYWNPSKISWYVGNIADYHTNNKRTDMTGTFENWSTEIWQFSDTEAPKLKWELISG